MSHLLRPIWFDTLSVILWMVRIMKFGIPHNIDVEPVVAGVEVLFIVVVANNAQA